MIRILQTDIYKAVRTASFWVILGIATVLSALLSFATFKGVTMVHSSYDEMVQLGLASSGMVFNFFHLVTTSLGICLLLVCIFAVLFSISDFSHGTIKNIASKGFHREYIYLSKFVTLLLFAIVSLALTFVTSWITAQIVVNNAIPNFFEYDNEFAKTLGLIGLQVVTYISIAIFLSTTFRSLGPALTSFLVFVFLEDKIVEWINKFIHDIFHSDFVITPYTISGAFAKSDQINHGIIVLCVYILAFTLVGMFLLRKRDIN